MLSCSQYNILELIIDKHTLTDHFVMNTCMSAHPNIYPISSRVIYRDKGLQLMFIIKHQYGEKWDLSDFNHIAVIGARYDNANEHFLFYNNAEQKSISNHKRQTLRRYGYHIGFHSSRISPEIWGYTGPTNRLTKTGQQCLVHRGRYGYQICYI